MDMIRRKQDSHVGYVIDTDEETTLAWCPKCLSRGTKTKLGEKIQMNDEPPKVDDDQFMQCPKCYLIVPIYNVKFQGDIYSDLEIVDNPFDYAKSQILGIDSRLGTRLKESRKKQKQHPDKEIARMEAQGWEVTSFSEDVPQDTTAQGFTNLQ